MFIALVVERAQEPDPNPTFRFLATLKRYPMLIRDLEQALPISNLANYLNPNPRVALLRSMERVLVIDSHTEGEPTRLVIGNGPELTGTTMAEKLDDFRNRFDSFRSAVVNEPRGSEAVVGALLCEPTSKDAAAGVIYFNNVGFLGMCGHGTIGLVASLAHLGKIGPGSHLIETPVGNVTADLSDDGNVTIRNVRSYRYRSDVEVQVEGYGLVKGDIGYGGNWFFLVGDSPVEVVSANIEALTHFSKSIKAALVANGITGENGAEIDHIEIFGDPVRADAHSKNYVLCPGSAYDRSPCGTGLSAKLACLAASGKLAPDSDWRQESIIGTMFVGRYEADGDGVLPQITGKAFVTGENTLVFSPDDPLRDGIQL